MRFRTKEHEGRYHKLIDHFELNDVSLDLKKSLFGTELLPDPVCYFASVCDDKVYHLALYSHPMEFLEICSEILYAWENEFIDEMSYGDDFPTLQFIGLKCESSILDEFTYQLGKQHLIEYAHIGYLMNNVINMNILEKLPSYKVQAVLDYYDVMIDIDEIKDALPDYIERMYFKGSDNIEMLIKFLSYNDNEQYHNEEQLIGLLKTRKRINRILANIKYEEKYISNFF